MRFYSSTSSSDEYINFRSSVPLRKISVDYDSSKIWSVFDSGPKSCHCPLLCLPPVSGTADVFFHQILGLSSKGIRVISVSYPVCWSVEEWCDGFLKLLNFLQLENVHLFGASLGGFLAQKFTEYTFRSNRVRSLILCNSFVDTTVFGFGDTASVLWIMPSVILKKMVLGNFLRQKMEPAIVKSVDFMVEKLESLSQSELASRLTLNCSGCRVDIAKIRSQQLPITIVDVFDLSALSNKVKDDVSRCFPGAKLAHLKSGGNFPYLSHPEEVNLFVEIHLRKFVGTAHNPFIQSGKQ